MMMRSDDVKLDVEPRLRACNSSSSDCVFVTPLTYFV